MSVKCTEIPTLDYRLQVCTKLTGVYVRELQKKKNVNELKKNIYIHIDVSWMYDSLLKIRYYIGESHKNISTSCFTLKA